MAEFKLTKSELRVQQQRLIQLQKYLPTLQLKKAMLQTEIQEARQEIQVAETLFDKQFERIDSYSALFSEEYKNTLIKASQIQTVQKRFENIAGLDVPYFESIEFVPFSYSLFDSPPWIDGAIQDARALKEAHTRIQITFEKKNALEHELREVSIRVNLFEKILIPRALRNIKKIKVFLGDQQLTAVSQAKVTKTKIEEALQSKAKSYAY